MNYAREDGVSSVQKSNSTTSARNHNFIMM